MRRSPRMKRVMREAESSDFARFRGLSLMPLRVGSVIGSGLYRFLGLLSLGYDARMQSTSSTRPTPLAWPSRASPHCSQTLRKNTPTGLETLSPRLHQGRLPGDPCVNLTMFPSLDELRGHTLSIAWLCLRTWRCWDSKICS